MVLPITIGSSVQDCSGMFNGASIFNQSVEMPNSVKNCSYMFYASTNFNQPVVIPNSVTNIDG